VVANSLRFRSFKEVLIRLSSVLSPEIIGLGLAALVTKVPLLVEFSSFYLLAVVAVAVAVVAVVVMMMMIVVANGYVYVVMDP
jgi:hypothetical protein